MTLGVRKTRGRIAVIGAGIGGVTAALLLQRAGHSVTIYEQAPALMRIGAGINLGPNALSVFRHVGALARLMATGIVAQRVLSREWDTGRILFERSNAEWADRFGLPTLTMHRGDLLAILASGLNAGTIEFDRRLAGLDPTGSSTRLRFEDGTYAEVEVVIGADGINSKVREILLGAQEPTYTGFVAYRSIFPAKLLGNAALSADLTKWWSDNRHPAAEDRHFISYYLTQGRDEVYFVTGSPEPNWPGGVNSIPAEISEIKRCYEGFHPEVQHMIDVCPGASKWPLLERDPMPLWSEDGIVLLGDACHPMKPHMGQGAAMAVEDAAVLVRCLTRDEDLASAFRRYRAHRHPRTAQVQGEARLNTWMKHPTDPAWVFGYDALTVSLEDDRELAGSDAA
jgi:6-hydroxynicotinate 3-monooxygenase